jgi:ribonucleoside-diphosphate reductase alpha chain
MNRVEVLATAIEYFKGDDLRANVWVDKYCLRDGDNYLESTPDDMFKRMTTEFARIEQKYPNPLLYEEIYELLKDFKYVIPGGSILYGVGNNYSFSTLGNCFVIGNTTDSYGSIMQIDEEQIQLMKRRGGVGHDLSHLRPKGSSVSNAANTSTGAVSFMNRYSTSTREVAQGGRRGALMLTMNIDHPDIVDFIVSKDDTTKLTGCNISVKVTDDFIDDVNTEFKPSVEIWNKLVHQAWKNGEPGVIFWDTVINNDPCSKYPYFKPISTNPCGEIPLCAYDTCRLMSVNLFSFIEKPFTSEAYFNVPKFIEVVTKAQRLMDDVVDLEEEKINRIINKIGDEEGVESVETVLWLKIKDKLLKGRRTGLSAIGLADCLAALGIQYGSDKSIKWCDQYYKLFHDVAYDSSTVMAGERGPFPIWDHTKDRVARRNIALLTIPPSGSLSILAGISSGIEPVFNLSYTRRRKVDVSDNVVFTDKQGDKWEEYIVFHSRYKQFMDSIPNNGVKENPYYGSTASEIDPMKRVELQATIQKHIDHSISSTINLPSTATEKQISDIYRYAWELGCKGITVYRDGCRDGVLINKDEKKTEFIQHNAPKRPRKLDCAISAVFIKGDRFNVVVGLLDGKPYELFALDESEEITDLVKELNVKIVKQSSGKYCLEAEDGSRWGNLTENLTSERAAITRLVSTALRHGTDIKFIVEQLEKTKGDLTSFSSAISRILKQYITNGSHLKGSMCEICGSKLIIQNGCESCTCGYTKCSQ